MKKPSFTYALMMLLSVVAIISVGILAFDVEIQMLMFISMFTLIPFMMGLGYNYKQIETSMFKSMSKALQSGLILLAVGMLIGTWMASGTVPTLIYYGINLISPRFFLVSALLFTSVVSLTTGTSWGAIGTAGIAMMGVGATLGVPAGITAGAVISGAYFGDKMSPLSDTTNLAPTVAGGTLFGHIKHMLWTTVPAYTITAVIFTFMGLKYTAETVNAESVNQLLTYLSSSFSIGIIPMIPIAVLIGLMMMKKPALPAIFIAAVVGGIIAVAYQGFGFSEVLNTMYSGYSVEAGIETVDSLLQRGGLTSMLPLIALFLFALGLGGMLADSGVLETLIGSFAHRINHTGTLVIVTVIVSYVTLAIGGAIYFSTVMTGTLMKPIFERMKLKPENLSRILEDTATQAGALIPWTGAGIYTAATLGVPVIAYLPYTFLAFITPMVSLFYGITGLTMTRMDKEEVQKVRVRREREKKLMMKSLEANS
ncbi:Na+/H+ antiporter NhaC [Proteiniclasticum sp. C24MP]|uniref:Na+/H+ antiporter NhaC n=1 Tax=Proteiniclasticum sp. C24MP TaxID=3374101 RepID=UPI00375439AF